MENQSILRRIKSISGFILVQIEYQRQQIVQLNEKQQESQKFDLQTHSCFVIFSQQNILIISSGSLFLPYFEKSVLSKLEKNFFVELGSYSPQNMNFRLALQESESDESDVFIKLSPYGIVCDEQIVEKMRILEPLLQNLVEKTSIMLLTPESEEEKTKLRRILNVHGQVYYSQSDVYQTQRLFTLASPSVLLSSDLFRNLIHQSVVSKVYDIYHYETNKTLLKQLFLLQSEVGLDLSGGLVLNKSYEIQAIILFQVEKLGHFCLNIQTIWYLLQRLDPEFEGKAEQSEQIFLKQRAKKSSFDQLFQKCLDSVCLVKGKKTFCTGVILNPSFILTVSHAFEPSEKSAIVQKANSQTLHSAAILAISTGSYDVCLLKLDTPIEDQPNLSVSFDLSNNCQLKSSVIAFGYTQSNTIQKQLFARKGLASKNINRGGIPSIIISNLRSESGFSGGPLFNLNGECIGLNYFNLIDIKKQQNIGQITFSYGLTELAEILDGILKNQLEDSQIQQLSIWKLKDTFLDLIDQLQTRQYIPQFQIDSKL